MLSCGATQLLRFAGTKSSARSCAALLARRVVAHRSDTRWQSVESQQPASFVRAEANIHNVSEPVVPINDGESRRGSGDDGGQNSGGTDSSGRSTSSDLWVTSVQFVQFAAFVYSLDRWGAYMSLTQGPSMLPTLAEYGDIVFVERPLAIDLGLRPPLRRGDIVIADAPVGARGGGGGGVGGLMPGEAHHVCKRIVALSGDIVQPAGRSFAFEVPAGHIWLEGDNPHNSTDSRAYGPLPVTAVRGRVVGRVWPPTALRWLGASPGGDTKPVKNAPLLAALLEDEVVRELSLAHINARRRAIEARRQWVGGHGAAGEVISDAIAEDSAATADVEALVALFSGDLSGLGGQLASGLSSHDSVAMPADPQLADAIPTEQPEPQELRNSLPPAQRLEGYRPSLAESDLLIAAKDISAIMVEKERKNVHH